MLLDRVRGCLLGVAVGDALGMPSEGMAPASVRRRWGWIDSLLPGEGRDLVAGRVTDDTEQTLMLAEAIVAAGGVVRAEVVAEHLVGWADQAADHAEAVIGPSTARALTQLRSGADPRTTGAGGTTNGAAMRVAPVGLLHPPQDIPALVDAVVESCVMSHDTGVATAGACLVAGAISAATEAPEGATGLEDVLGVAVRAAELGAGRGGPPGGDPVLDAVARAREVAHRPGDDATFLQAVHTEVGTSVQTAESVPAAVACLLRADGDPARTAVLAANVGGDTDTIGAMATGIAGALRGEAALPAALVAQVVEVNQLDIDRLAVELSGYRNRQD